MWYSLVKLTDNRANDNVKTASSLDAALKLTTDGYKIIGYAESDNEAFLVIMRYLDEINYPKDI
jgi:hypothetical protein